MKDPMPSERCNSETEDALLVNVDARIQLPFLVVNAVMKMTDLPQAYSM